MICYAWKNDTLVYAGTADCAEVFFAGPRKATPVENTLFVRLRLENGILNIQRTRYLGIEDAKKFRSSNPEFPTPESGHRYDWPVENGELNCPLERFQEWGICPWIHEKNPAVARQLEETVLFLQSRAGIHPQ